MAKKPSAKRANYQLKKKKLAQAAAKRKVKELRPYLSKAKDIDLRKRLTPAQLGYITKAFNEYQELTARPVKVFRSRNKKHLAQAQAFARHDKNAPKFNVAFIPVADPKAKLIFKGNKLKIKTKYVTETAIFFDLENLATDPKNEIERAMSENPNADQFVIMAGKYLYNGGIVRSRAIERTMQLMARYSDPEQNNFWGNWLFGFVAAEYHNQKDFDIYRKEYAKQKDKVLRQRENARKKWRQQYGSEYSCKECGQKFDQYAKLKAHIKSKHNG